VDRVTPTSVPVVEGGALDVEREPVQLLGEEVFARSGDTLWAWVREGGDGRIAGYRNGTWVSLPPLPGIVLDVSGDADGTVWAVSTIDRSSSNRDHGVWYLENGVWRQLYSEWLTEANAVEVDEASGLVWVVSSDLFSWDGEELTRRGSPPQEMAIDLIAVAGDGTVWASFFNPFVPPGPAGLVRYHPGTDRWEWVRPLGGDENVPAVLAPTPAGDLWVLLEDYRGEVTPALAHLDSSTGRWTVSALPEGATWSDTYGPGGWAADDEAFWLTWSPSVLRFDGQTWTVSPVHRTIYALGIAADGTVWASGAAGILRLGSDDAAGR
jgi:hypothetical protein